MKEVESIPHQCAKGKTWQRKKKSECLSWSKPSIQTKIPRSPSRVMIVCHIYQALAFLDNTTPRLIFYHRLSKVAGVLRTSIRDEKGET